MHMFTHTRRGFTLIELLVVVLIIGILAAIALPQYQKVVKKSQAMEAITALKALAEAEQTYYLANGNYTANLADLDIDMPPLSKGKVDIALNEYDGYSIIIAPDHPDGDNYFVYYLPTQRMACSAVVYDEDKQNYCKLFSTRQEDCSEGHTLDGYTCFYLN